MFLVFFVFEFFFVLHPLLSPFPLWAVSRTGAHADKPYTHIPIYVYVFVLIYIWLYFTTPVFHSIGSPAYPVSVRSGPLFPFLPSTPLPPPFSFPVPLDGSSALRPFWLSLCSLFGWRIIVLSASPPPFFCFGVSLRLFSAAIPHPQQYTYTQRHILRLLGHQLLAPVSAATRLPFCGTPSRTSTASR